MSNLLIGLKIAVLVANGFELPGLLQPKDAFEQEGAQVIIVSPEKNKVLSWFEDKWTQRFKFDVPLDEADSKNYDALIIPGGIIHPDKLRLSTKSIEFIKSFGNDKKLIIAMGHGPSTLIDAELVKNKFLTSWRSIKIDLINAGSKWIDQEVVIDDNLITSQSYENIPQLIKEAIKILAKLKENK